MPSRNFAMEFRWDHPSLGGDRKFLPRRVYRSPAGGGPKRSSLGVPILEGIRTPSYTNRSALSSRRPSDKPIYFGRPLPADPTILLNGRSCAVPPCFFGIASRTLVAVGFRSFVAGIPFRLRHRRTKLVTPNARCRLCWNQRIAIFTSTNSMVCFSNQPANHRKGVRLASSGNSTRAFMPIRGFSKLNQKNRYCGLKGSCVRLTGFCIASSEPSNPFFVHRFTLHDPWLPDSIFPDRRIASAGRRGVPYC